jgi:hypothetical protein
MAPLIVLSGVFVTVLIAARLGGGASGLWLRTPLQLLFIAWTAYFGIVVERRAGRPTAG